MVLPMPTEASEMGSKPQPEINSPFLRIKHAVKIKVVCRNAGSNEDAVSTSCIYFRSLFFLPSISSSIDCR